LHNVDFDNNTRTFFFHIFFFKITLIGELVPVLDISAIVGCFTYSSLQKKIKIHFGLNRLDFEFLYLTHPKIHLT